MMMCALEMLKTTEEERAVAIERLAKQRLAEELKRQRLEEERKRKEEEERNKIITQARINTEKFVDEKLTEFKIAFKDFGGDPFSFVYRCSNTEYSFTYDSLLPSYILHKIYIEEKNAYVNGDNSYGWSRSEAIDISYLKELLNKLCYTVTIEKYRSDNYRHYGSGGMEIAIISIGLNPACLEN